MSEPLELDIVQPVAEPEKANADVLTALKDKGFDALALIVTRFDTEYGRARVDALAKLLKGLIDALTPEMAEALSTGLRHASHAATEAAPSWRELYRRFNTLRLRKGLHVLLALLEGMGETS
jgi:hypothetical protein